MAHECVIPSCKREGRNKLGIRCRVWHDPNHSSARQATIPVLMNEAHFAEIERTLLFISEARKRADKASRELRGDGAHAHLVVALEEAEKDLEAVGRHLMQATYFAVPNGQLSIEPAAEELTLS